MNIYKKEINRLLIVLCWLALVLIAAYLFWKTRDPKVWSFFDFLPVIAVSSIVWIPILWIMVETCISPIIFICKDRKWVKYTYLYNLVCPDEELTQHRTEAMGIDKIASGY